MSSSFGYNQIVTGKDSASYGSAEDLTTGTRWRLLCRAATEMEKTFGYMASDSIRQTLAEQPEDDAQGLIDVGGGLSGVVPVNGDFGNVLKHTAGKVTTTGPTGTKYTHLYHFNDLHFPGFSLGVDGRAGAAQVYDGAQTAELILRIRVGAMLEWTWTIKGRDERILASIATPPTLPALGDPAYWLCQHATFSLDGVSKNLTEAEIRIMIELADADEDSYALGSDKRVALARKGYGVDLNLKRRHDNDGTNMSLFYTKFLSGAVANLIFTFTHPSDADYTGTIRFGNCKLRGTTPKPVDKGYVPEIIPAKAFKLNDTATSFIQFTDKLATPANATGAYTGTGV